MPQPAARMGDMHVCPMVIPNVVPIPHVGGPIMQGSPTVFINGQPAATMGSIAICVGPPDNVIMGSATVMINGKPAARMWDSTGHGGIILLGSPTVFIGGPTAVAAGAPAMSFLDQLQLALDIVGLIPGYGEAADFINGLISLGRGDKVGAALSFAAMIPIAGWGATAVKFSRKGMNIAQIGVKGTDTAKTIVKQGDETGGVVKNIYKNKPKNSPDVKKWKEKGGTVEVADDGTWKYTDWEGNTVNYKDGYPDFKPYERQSVEIDDLQGNRSTDFTKADAKAPKGPKLEENSWHHHEDTVTMQELPKEIHNRFTHIGGVSILKKKKK